MSAATPKPLTPTELDEDAARMVAVELAEHIEGRIDATNASLIREPGNRWLIAQRECLAKTRNSFLRRAGRDA